MIELAVALAVVTLILGSILVPLTAQVEQRQISDTRKTLEEIKEALIGFAITKGRLPCPASSTASPLTGLEQATCTGLAGSPRSGFIPWATLGVSKLDAWGHIFRYSVTPAYATPFTFSTGRDMTIQTRIAGVVSAVTTVNDIPAVVISHGKNGYGSVDEQGIAQALPADWPASNLDEQVNATSSIAFVSRVPQAPGIPGPGGEFDDIVVWISPSILFNRMVAAGKLP